MEWKRLNGLVVLLVVWLVFACTTLPLTHTLSLTHQVTELGSIKGFSSFLLRLRGLSTGAARSPQSGPWILIEPALRQSGTTHSATVNAQWLGWAWLS
jgi:hypothetical protein